MRPQAAPRCPAPAALPRGLEMDGSLPVKIPLRADMGADPLFVADPFFAAAAPPPPRSPRETLANLTAQMLSTMHQAAVAEAARAAEEAKRAGDRASAVPPARSRASPEWHNEVLTVFDRAVEQVQWASVQDAGLSRAGASVGGLGHATRNTRALHNLRGELLDLLAACPARAGAGEPEEAADHQHGPPWPQRGAGPPGARPPPPRCPPRGEQTAPPPCVPRHGAAARAPVRGARRQPQGGAGAGRAAAAQPGGPQQPKERQAHNLSSSLQLLSGENQDCIVIVRRINKLGFKGVPKLTRYFSSFGQVVRVLVAHSHTLTAKEQAGGSKDTCQRPSSLGFVLMAAPEAARAVLARGAEQEVEGVAIRVQRFEHKGCQDEEAQLAAAPHPPDGPATPAVRERGGPTTQRRRGAQEVARLGADASSSAASEEKAGGLSEASTQ